MIPFFIHCFTGNIKGFITQRSKDQLKHPVPVFIINSCPAIAIHLNKYCSNITAAIKLRFLMGPAMEIIK